MADTTPASSPAAMPTVPEGRVRNLLIAGSVGLFAAIIFGLLYLFVIAPAIPAGGEGWSVGWFLFSFATGLTMIVLPCTLPLAFVIVPLSMGKGLLKGLSMALAFGIGVATTLSLYGVAAAIVGGLAIDTLGAPLESVKNWVYFIAGIFALIFALSEIGLLKFHMPTYKGAAPAFIQKRQDTLKAFLLGLFLGNIGVGCPHPATPLLLIEVASSGDIFYGWLMFLVHALGRILPLLLLAFLAILGVNGLNWLMARKDAVERATGWAMVFVAGFILTLGLFSHDWWVNSGLHTGLEKLTQEHRFNVLLNDTLGTAVAHVHGFELGGQGLFGLPLELGSWFLVLVWLIPIWWWWLRKRNHLLNSPVFRLQALEHRIDLLEKDRRQVEALIGLDDKETAFDLAKHQAQMDALEKERRMAEELVQFGESSVLKDPTARVYELRLLRLQRNYLLVVSVFLVMTFTYFIPQNFYLSSLSMADHHGAGAAGDHHGTATEGASGHMTGAMGGTLFSKDIANLPSAVPSKPVALNDGDNYDITASYVKKEVGNRVLRMLAYNGSIPGPMLMVPEGAEITVNFKNNTDVEQTIHSHGIRLDNNFDGVPNLTQDAVPPGGSFSYKVRFKDAGLYWYHPHTRDDYGQEMGLYGNYLVDPADPEHWSPVNKEVPLVIDDILIDNNQIADFYKEFTTHALLGRFGNEYLVNGLTNYGLSVRQGDVVRFYVTNVSNARTYKLSIPGADMKVVGSDAGRYEREFFANDFLISPAERMIVEAHFPKAGVYSLTHTLPDNEVQLATFFVEDGSVAEPSYVDQFLTTRTNLEEVKEFSDLRQYFAAEPEKKIRLSVDMGGMMVDHSGHAHSAAPADESAAHDHGSMPMMSASGDQTGIQWGDPTGDMMNTTQHIRWRMIDEATGKENMDVHWSFKQGSKVKMRIFNDPNADHVMQHPIHFHGQRFVVLARNGVENTNMVWKDTDLVLPGETVDILVDMSELGEWMAHCHISEHLHAGMMVGFRVEDQNGYATGDEYRASKGITPSAPASVAGTGETPTSSKFSFSTVLPETNYTAVPTRKFYPSEKLQQLAFSLTDRSGTYIDLSRDVSRPLTVTFVKSDDSVVIETYPGNTAFDNYAPPKVPAAPAMPAMPASDGHNHIHMNFLNVAYADAGHAENMPHIATPMSTYTVPVVFPSRGVYRAFVEFTPLGGSEVRTVSFNVEVGTSGFSVDNFGWSPKTKWWTLLIISIIIILPLSYAVYRYLKAAEQAAVVKK